MHKASFLESHCLPDFQNIVVHLLKFFLCKLTEGSLKSTSGILINQISDHLPCFICMDCILTRDMVPKFITITQKSPDSLNKFRSELINSNIYDKLNKNIDGNPNEKYNVLEEIQIL